MMMDDPKGLSSPDLHGSRAQLTAFRDSLAPHLIALVIIGAICGSMGSILIHAHWTSIWMDREFTGWVAPIAARIANGQALYTEGAHSPIPPLPAVLMRFLYGHDARWIDESRLNFIFQCGILIVSYISLSRWLPRPVPLIAAIAGAGFLFALPKTILYDSMAQFLAALAIAIVSALFWRLLERGSRVPLGGHLVVLGAVLAALILTKQSTAAGLIAGIFVTLLVFPSSST